MVYRAALSSLVVAMALAPLSARAASHAFATPKIVATVELPKAGASTEPDHIGIFTTGKANAIAVDADTKQKLDDLAATYQKTATDNYGLIIHALKLEDKAAPCKIVHIVVTYGYGGVAATSWPSGLDGPRIEVSAKYALAHPSDIGMIVHEMVHVVQNYHFNDSPGWLVEAMADWVRWYIYEPGKDNTKFTQKNAIARSPYRIGARFLDWTTHKYCADLVPKINAALQADTYSEEIFKTLTGKSLDDLAAEWNATFPAS